MWRGVSPARAYSVWNKVRKTAAMPGTRLYSTGVPLRGVVFDMDGTLTVPCLDFKEMRRRVGIDEGGDILDVIKSWSPEKQAKAHATIMEIELEALRDLKVMPGVIELCEALDAAGIPRGLITRNVMKSVDYLHAQHFSHAPFSPAITRECDFPYKPSPAALQHICSSWGVSTSEVIMVGDSVKDDVVSGNRAGSISVLFDWQQMAKQSLEDFEGELRPSLVVHSMHELREVIFRDFQLLPPNQLA